MSKHPCYDENSLKQFLTGKLPDQEAPQVEEHLLECDRCADTVHDLASTDTLAGAMKSPDLSDSQHSDTAALADRLMKLRTTPDAETIDTIDAPRSVDDVTLAITSLLSPPVETDELGRLGDYRILKVLGAGGMGVVFQAEDIHLKRNVALKVMKREIAANPQSRERFMREAQATAALEHDNIVTIYRVGEENNMPYLAMQMLAGSSLKDRLTRGKALPLKQVLRLGKQIAEGLAVAHEAGLIHRDIKPANIWIEPVAGGRAKILDFGLARSVKSDATVTKSGQILGTPAYMSPEQASGKMVDERCDLFSLGCVLYQLCTGNLPFRGGDTMAVLMALATEDPTPPNAINPNIPKELSDFVMKLLAKNADERVSSAKEVLATLRKIEKALDITTSLLAVTKPKQSNVGARSPDLAPAPTAGLTKPVGDLRSSPAAGSGDPRRTPEPRRMGNRARRRIYATVGVLVLGVLAYLYGGTILRFVTNQGTLVIEVKDPNIQVLIKQNGLQVEDKTTKRTFTLKAEKGRIEVYEKDGVGPLLTKKFTLNRGGKTTVVVTLQELAKAKQPKENLPANPSSRNMALLFDGKSSHVKIPSLKYDGRHPITIEATVTPFRIAHGGAVIGDSELAGITLNAGITFYQGKKVSYANKTWNFLVWNGDKYAFAISKENVSLNDQVHVAGVFNGQTAQLFVNGRLRATAPAKDPFKPSEFPMMIGASPAKHPWNSHYHFPGIIDEVRISKVARYTKDFTPAKRFAPDKDILALYHFDEGQGDKLTDSSGNGHHGKIVGAKWVKVDSTMTDPDRLAAEYVISLGGSVRIFYDGRHHPTASKLPAKPFQLTYVDLFNKPVSDEGFAVFERCENLQVLVLRATGVTAKGLAHFRNNKNLRTLYFNAARQIDDAGLAHFKECKQLVEFFLAGTKTTDAGLAHFRECKELKLVDLDNTAVTDAGLIHLYECKKLQGIDLTKTKVTAAGVAALQKALPKCTIAWDGSNAGIDRRAAEYAFTIGAKVWINGQARMTKKLADLPQKPFRLTGVSFAKNRKANDESLARFKKCREIQKLGLWASSITDAGLAHFDGTDKVTYLVLADNKNVTDKGLSYFRNSKKIKLLKLSHTKITDAGLAQFSHCGDLSELHLAGLPITKSGLDHFKNCKKLTNLDLQQTAVGDESVALIGSWRNLQSLDVRATRITAAGVAALQKALPVCRIEWDSDGDQP